MRLRTNVAGLGTGLNGPPGLLFMAALLTAAGGCGQGKSASDANPAGARGASRTVVSNWGAYRVTLAPREGPIPLNEPFEIRFRVERAVTIAARAGLSEIDVAVDAEMPAHHHGMTRIPVLRRLSEGSYLARGLVFHMPGHWQLEVDITEDGRTDRAELGIDLP